MIRKSIALLGTAMIAMAVTPAAHAEDRLIGLTCGFTSTTNPNSQDPNEQTGEIDAHTTLHNSSGGLTSMTVECTIQYNDENYGGTAVVTRSNVCTPPNPLVRHVIVCVVADTFIYSPPPGTSVYICTEITWSSDKGGGTYQHDDDDDPSNGNQCTLAVSVEA